MRDLNQSYAQFVRAKRRAKARREYEAAVPITDDREFALTVFRQVGGLSQFTEHYLSIVLREENKDRIEPITRILQKTTPEWFGTWPGTPRIERLATRKRQEKRN